MMLVSSKAKLLTDRMLCCTLLTHLADGLADATAGNLTSSFDSACREEGNRQCAECLEGMKLAIHDRDSEG